MRLSSPVVWFYKALSLSEKVYAMCFRVILKKCISGLTLAGVLVWLAGCAETSSTPKPAPSSPSTKVPASTDASPKSSLKSDGSVASDSGSSGTESAAGSETDSDKGREVPDAAPATDDAGAKPADENSADDKPADEKSDSE